MLTISKKNVVEFKKDKKFNVEFDNLKWVLTGREKNKWGKEIFQCVYVDSKNIVCTNAKRLFILENNLFETPIPEGLYSVSENTSQKITLVETVSDLPFPNYRRIIPDAENIVVFFLTTAWFRDSTLSKIYGAFYKTFPKQKMLAVNNDYLKDAVGKNYNFSISASIKDNQFDNKAPLIINSEKRLALVMPIVVED